MYEKMPLKDLESASMRAYDQVAQGYDKSSHQTMRLIEKITAKYLKIHLNDFNLTSARCLLVGGGTGFYANELKKKTNSICSIDISYRMLKNADRNYCRLVQGSAFFIPFATQSFDVSLSLLSGAFLNQQALNEIRRVMRPNGIMVTSETTSIFTNTLWDMFGFQKDTATIKDNNGQNILAPYPFSYTENELIEAQERCGFNVMSIQSLSMNYVDDQLHTPSIIEQIGNAISMEPRQIPIVWVCISQVD